MTGDATGLVLHVAVSGDDEANGRTATAAADDGPFATLEGARDELRRLKQAGELPHGATVKIHAGVYELRQPFALNEADSGAADAPIVWRAAGDGPVVISGGRRVTDFSAVTDAKALERLDPAVRDRVRHTDLKSLGIDDFGEPDQIGKRMELFFNEEPMTPARWPNDGFTTVEDVLGIEPVEVHGIPGDKVGRFIYTGDRPARWVDEPAVFLHGYWFWDWSDAMCRVESIDTEKRVIRLAEPYHNYGYRKGQRFYAFGLLCELDEPGEWHVDLESGVLYFLPPAPIEDGRAVVSVLPSVIEASDASHVTWRGVIFEATRATAVTVSGGEGMRLVGCTFRNIGGWGAKLNGMRHAMVGCDLFDVGEGGVTIDGGDRVTLTPGDIVVDNCQFTRFSRVRRTYGPAVLGDGVGHRITHNHIHHAPHVGILLHGNEHLIEFNELHDLCYETGDVGAFYIGRDWTERGMVVRHNYFHHIEGPGLWGANAVYLDDAASGTVIFGNVFHRAGRAAFIGGGRDNVVENNLFIDNPASVHIDERGLTWMNYHVDPDAEDAIMPNRLRAMPIDQPPWSDRYPMLQTLLDDEPAAPKYNVVRRNVHWKGTWLDVADRAKELTTWEDNLVDVDPHFIDEAGRNFQLRDDSPAYDVGFERIPIDQIGLYQSDDRATWPVDPPVGDTSPVTESTD